MKRALLTGAVAAAVLGAAQDAAAAGAIAKRVSQLDLDRDGVVVDVRFDGLATVEDVRRGGRYPLLLIDLNPGETRLWNGIELKATTNNFDGASSVVFLGATARNGTTAGNPTALDWFRLFVLSQRAGSDARRWTRVKNTGEMDGYAPLALAIVVDPELLKRGQGDGWLYEGNRELVWSYLRIGIDQTETDQDGRQCWRPAMPAKWYAELPDWANEEEEAFDASGVADYVTPWEEAISNAIARLPEPRVDLTPATNYTDQLKTDLQLGNVKVDQANIADEAKDAWNAEGLIVDPTDAGTRRSSTAIFTQIDKSTSDITTLGNQVSSIGSYLNAEDARFVSTNYDSVTRTPEAYVEVRLNDHGTNKWVEIWREMTRWNKFTGLDFNWDNWSGFNTFRTNVTTELSYKADRAWGAYDSETGGYSPEGYTQISSSNILVAAGMAYQRTITSDGAVWVLQCNQGTATLGGDTNGYFRISDADGNTQFEIIKGDRREMGADASGITVSGNVMTIPYSVEAEEHPVIQCTATLDSPNWKAETDPDCLCTVTWSPTQPWVATVTPKTSQPSMFVKATYMAGGETYIRNAVPVGMDSIILNGVKYYLGTATIDGHTVLTLSTTAP